MGGIEYDKVAVISTAHITQEVARYLDDVGDSNPWTYVGVYEHGYVVYIQPEVIEEPDEPTPKCLLDIYEWAKKHGFPWVRLDCDANRIDELPQYEW